MNTFIPSDITLADGVSKWWYHHSFSISYVQNVLLFKIYTAIWKLLILPRAAEVLNPRLKTVIGFH